MSAGPPQVIGKHHLAPTSNVPVNTCLYRASASVCVNTVRRQDLLWTVVSFVDMHHKLVILRGARDEELVGMRSRLRDSLGGGKPIVKETFR